MGEIKRMKINNIFCVGRNYVAHAYELGNEVPNEQILFSKPTHALVFTNGQKIALPKNKGTIHHELEIVLRIGKQVQPGDKVDEVVSHMALGLDLTLRDVQTKLKECGYPWLRAKGFKNSAIATTFWSFPGVAHCKRKHFSLTKNGAVVQKGNIMNMIFSFQAIINECATHFGLHEGDLIYTGTPEGVGPLQSGDECVFFWGEAEKGRFVVE